MQSAFTRAAGSELEIVLPDPHRSGFETRKGHRHVAAAEEEYEEEEEQKRPHQPTPRDSELRPHRPCRDRAGSESGRAGSDSDS